MKLLNIKDINFIGLLFMTVPYTYVLTHKPSGKKYYGVRFKKNCHPSDLWNKYFSSSKIVHRLIEQDGIDSFDFEIRQTFSSKDKAIEWELKVIQKLKLHNNVNWLNMSVGKAQSNSTSFGMLGKFCSEETKRKIGEAQLGSKNHMFGKTHSPESRKKISEGNLGRKHSDETKKKLSNIMKGRDVGFGKGWKHKPEVVERIASKNRGKKRTLEQRQKMRESRIRYLNSQKEKNY